MFHALPVHSQTLGRQHGVVSEIITLHTGQVVFAVTGDRQPSPACSTTGRWAIDTATPGGQALMAHLLSAHAAGKTIIVQGGGICQIWGDSENVVLLQMQ